MTHGHERLRKAPLKEAVFELRAETEASFTLLPGKISADLEADYPLASETELARFAGVMTPPPGAPFMPTHQFRTADQGGLVQLGPMGITVNFLAYPGFEAFRESVQKTVATYAKHASIRAVRRLGIRYVNGLAGSRDLLAGLTASVRWPNMDGAELTNVAARGIFRYSEPEGKLAVAIAAPHDLGTVLDLDFFHEPEDSMSTDQILGWLDVAHERAYDAFCSMTDPALIESWR